METKSKRSPKKIGVLIPMQLPDGVTASLHGQALTVKGPKGDVTRTVKEKNISVKIEGSNVTISAKRATKNNKKIAFSLAAHLRNMIRGSQEKHSYTMKICSGHFPINVAVTGAKLVVKNFLGEKVPRSLHLKQGAEVKVEGDHIHITSVSKEIAGQIAADIEQLTRRPGFDTRIFQDGIYITIKDGKELK